MGLPSGCRLYSCLFCLAIGLDAMSNHEPDHRASSTLAGSTGRGLMPGQFW